MLGFTIQIAMGIAALHASYALFEILHKPHASCIAPSGAARFDVGRHTIGCQAFVRCEMDYTRSERAGP
jgi:hypothetical protein